MFSQIKVWSKKWNNSVFFDEEYRIYVDMSDGRSGCLYITGNPHHPKGEIAGKLSAAEWEIAKKLSIWDGKWHTLRRGEIPMREQALSLQVNEEGEYEKVDRFDYLELPNAS